MTSLNSFARRTSKSGQTTKYVLVSAILSVLATTACGLAPVADRFVQQRQAGRILSPGSVTTIPYLRVGADEQTQGRLFLPRSDLARRSTVVLIHGGGWKGRVSARSLDRLATQLQAYGNPVWNVEYRRVGIGGGWDTTFTDVAHAMDYIAVLAARTPLVNADDIVVVGHSAGGQLAAWTASRAVRPTQGPGPIPTVVPRAVVSLAGVLNMAATGRITTNARDILGGYQQDVPRRHAAVNPIQRINIHVPMIVVHAIDDRVVAYSVGIEYLHAAQRLGAKVRMIRLPSGGHAGPLVSGRGFAATWSAILSVETPFTGIKYTRPVR